MNLIRRTGAWLACLILLPAFAFAQQGTVSGTVTDALTGDPLPGANVILTEPGGTTSSLGAATDFDGNYTVANVPAGSYDLIARFIGYNESRQPVTVTAGQTVTINVALDEQGVGLNTVVVTASRQQEKVLDAPAAISVLSARDVEEQGTTSAAGVLRNVTGLDASQTGADRVEIALRGFNNAFSGAAFTLVDYRQASIASLGVNSYNAMPISNIDIDRVEVVRGPGSALYGAGVDSGVIHFITKGPFSSPGTTVSVYGGQRSMAGVNFRHAGVVNENLGYKVTGTFAQVDDWELDPSDPEDAVQLSSDAVARDYAADKFNLGGQLEFRPDPATSLVLNGGYSQSTNIYLSGIGTLQGDEFGYSYGQVRLQSGGLFAQAFLNMNNAGNSFVYGTGEAVVDNSTLFNAQAQYDMELFEGRNRLIFGADFERTAPDTEGTIYGRNEEDDTILETGAYVQSATNLTDQLDLTVAGRVDYNNVVDAIQLSPRVALVYKVTDAHSLRGTYNRAFSSPGTNSLFLDIVAQQIPVDPSQNLFINVRGRGPGDGFTYSRNEAFRAIAGTDLVTTYNLPFPGVYNTQGPAGVPLDLIYGLVYSQLVNLTTDQINAALGVTLSDGLVATLKDQLAPQNTSVTGFSQGVLGRPNSDGGLDFIQDVVDIPPLEQTTTQTIEVGYKGIFNNKVLLAVDAYYTRKENFVGPLLFETPFVFVPGLGDDFTAALQAGIEGNPTLAALANVEIPGVDLSPENLARQIAGLAAASLPGATDPIGIVQVNENIGVDNPEVLLSYRNFGEIDLYGVDISTQILISENLDFFGSISLVNDNFFDDEEVGEPGTGKVVALNAPSTKFKLGGNYRQDAGLSFGLSSRYVDSFPVASGPYVGTVDSYFLLDLSAGYDLAQFTPGLRVDLNVQNILNNEHRQFVGAPKLGRFTTGRITYSF